MSDDMYRDRYFAVQKVLDCFLGTEEEEGAGEGIAADVALLGEQRDEARARLAALLAAARSYVETYDGTAAVELREERGLRRRALFAAVDALVNQPEAAEETEHTILVPVRIDASELFRASQDDGP